MDPDFSRDYETAIRRVTRRILDEMVRAVRGLMDLYPQLGSNDTPQRVVALRTEETGS